MIPTVVVAERRTPSQNQMFHGICSCLAKARTEWAGKPRTADEWKLLLISGHAIVTRAENEIVKGLEGELINLRESSSKMHKDRANSLISYSLAWCAMHGVVVKYDR